MKTDVSPQDNPETESECYSTRPMNPQHKSCIHTHPEVKRVIVSDTM